MAPSAIIRLRLVAALFVLLSPTLHLCPVSAAAAGAAADSPPEPTTVPCPVTLSQASCYLLSVPLQHSHPRSSVRIPINYAVITPPPLSSSSSFSSTPSSSQVLDSALLYIPGGPGGSALNSAVPRVSETVAASIGRPVVLFDLRGTGNYSRLVCRSQLPAQRKAELNRTGAVLQVADEVNALRQCMIEAGPSGVYYSTRAIAADIDLLRRALNVKRLDLFGVSYGTVIAQMYAMMFPHGTRSLILDSPRPVKYGRTEVFDPGHMQEYQRIFAHRDNVNVTELLNDLDTTLIQLRRRPLTVNIPSNDAKRTGLRKVILNADLLFNLYRAVVPGLPQALDDAAGPHKNTTLLERIVVQFALLSPLTTGMDFRRSSFAVLSSVLCNDLLRVMPWNFKTIGINRRMAAVRRSVMRNRRLRRMFEPFKVSEALFYVRFCTMFPFRQRWAQGLPSRKERMAVVPSHVKTLVLVGEWDSVTPLKDLELLDESVRRNVAVVKETGHVATATPCAFELMVEFASNLSVSNVNACA